MTVQAQQGNCFQGWGEAIFGASSLSGEVCPCSSGKAVAVFDKEKTFRYALAHCFNEDCKPLMWVMLNPSTATQTDPDMTVTKCKGFTERIAVREGEESGGLVIVNLFAYRATNWRELRCCPDPVGPGNDEWIQRTLRSGQISKIVVAWGGKGRKFPERRDNVKRLLRGEGIPIFQLGESVKGEPRHPSRASYDNALCPYRG